MSTTPPFLDASTPRQSLWDQQPELPPWLEPIPAFKVPPAEEPEDDNPPFDPSSPMLPPVRKVAAVDPHEADMQLINRYADRRTAVAECRAARRALLHAQVAYTEACERLVSLCDDDDAVAPRPAPTPEAPRVDVDAARIPLKEDRKLEDIGIPPSVCLRLIAEGIVTVGDAMSWREKQPFTAIGGIGGTKAKQIEEALAKI